MLFIVFSGAIRTLNIRDQIASAFLFFCSSIFFLPLSESVYFKLPEAIATNNVVCLGDATIGTTGTIDFNRINYPNRVGHVQYSDAVPIWDSKSGKLSDFSTHFTFIIDTLAQSSYGDGLVFFLAPDGFNIPPNSAGGFLGILNQTYYDSPQNQMIFIEFDSFVNPKWDPPFEHVGINKNLISVNYTEWNASMHSGDPIDVWVLYNATTYTLNVSWRCGSSKNTSPENTSISYHVDLREVLPEWVTIGFSAVTGTNIEINILQYWEFNSSLVMVKREGNKSNKTKLIVGLTGSIGVVVVVVVGIAACCVLFRRQKQDTNTLSETVTWTSINEDLERGAAKRFSYHDLALATNNFSNDQKLGEGGFGCVYKGYLSHEGITVAVKKISQGSKQGKKEYITEVKINSSLRHRNLVQLIGWCHDQSQFLIVYEFMPNGSLDSHLFGNKIFLEWGVRYKIATGLASALLYLHEDWKQCVVHRDIKPSNIMLDSEFNVKLGDFGLARLMEHELGQHTTGLAGTLGYMAPEYITTGKASKESDVYSFGVVALEIACGQRVTDRVDQSFNLGLVQWVWDLHGNGMLLSGVDKMLKNEFDVKQLECLMMVGLWCAHPDRRMRPSMRQAIKVLMFEDAIPNLPMKMPEPVYYIAPADVPQVSSAGATMTNSSTDLER